MIDKIKEIISTVFQVDTANIKGDFSPKDTEKWDSLNHMKLIMALEKEYKIMFDANEVPKMINIGVIEKTITNKI